MCIVYLLRHGRTAMDVLKRSDGWLDLPLSDKGRMGLIEAQQYLKLEPLLAIYAPPLRRAQETAHILRVLFSALLARRSAYASALAALLDLAGEKAERVKLPEEPALDDSWAEPAAFVGCSTAGQARPGQPQPIRIVKNHPQPGATA